MPSRVALSLLLALFLAACEGDAVPVGAARPDLSRDHFTFSNSDHFRSTHLELDLEVDFGLRELRGHVIHHLERLDPGASSIVMDSRGLDIQQVSIARPGSGPRVLDFDLGRHDPVLGEALSIEVVGQPRPVSLEAVPFPSVTAARVTLFRDIELISVTPQIQLERGLVSEDGALIADISPELTRQLGLQSGDVIIQMNRSRIRSADDAAEFFDSLRGEGRIVLYLERDGQYGTTNLYWRG